MALMRLTEGKIWWPLLLFLGGVTSPAAEFDKGPMLTLTEENDTFAGQDRWYTQAAKIAFLQADNDLPRWTEPIFDHAPTLGFESSADRIGYEIGQSMFTPANTRTSEFLPNDRPYAGWLYAGLVLQRRGFGWADLLTLENLEVQLGIIGPESMADRIQTWYHHQAPQGWEHQIKDEPGIAVKYGRAWRIALPAADEHYIDLLPRAGLSAGNVDTSFRAATTLRVGWDLPDDFGVQPIESVIDRAGGRSRSPGAKHWGFYLFTGVEGRAVLYTVFLDGNAFRESHHVSKEPFVGEWASGVALVFDRVEIAYTHIFRSREFEQQPEGQAYGSVSVAVRF